MLPSLSRLWFHPGYAEREEEKNSIMGRGIVAL